MKRIISRSHTRDGKKRQFLSVSEERSRKIVDEMQRVKYMLFLHKFVVKIISMDSYEQFLCDTIVGMTHEIVSCTNEFRVTVWGQWRKISRLCSEPRCTYAEYCTQPPVRLKLET